MGKIRDFIAGMLVEDARTRGWVPPESPPSTPRVNYQAHADGMISEAFKAPKWGNGPETWPRQGILDVNRPYSEQRLDMFPEWGYGSTGAAPRYGANEGEKMSEYDGTPDHIIEALHTYADQMVTYWDDVANEAKKVHDDAAEKAQHWRQQSASLTSELNLRNFRQGLSDKLHAVVSGDDTQDLS